MSFGDIPIRQNGFDHIVDASWWNSIRTELVNAFGAGAYIFVQDTQTLDDDDPISLEVTAFKPFVPVQGNLAEITVNSIPFTTAHGRKNGAEIIIMGVSDDYPVNLVSNDAPDGFILNGASVKLMRWHKISFVYLEDLERFLEIGRNF